MERQSFPEFLSGFSEYLNENGFVIDQNFIVDYLKLVNKLKININNKNELENTLRPFLVKNKHENKDFSFYFNNYLKTNGDVIVTDKNKNKILKLLEEKSTKANSLKNITEKINQLNLENSLFNSDFIPIEKIQLFDKEMNEIKSFFIKEYNNDKLTDKIIRIMDQISKKNIENLDFNEILKLEQNIMFNNFDSLEKMNLLRNNFNSLNKNLTFLNNNKNIFFKTQTKENEFKELNDKKEKLKQSLLKIENDFNEIKSLIIKSNNLLHRKEFHGKNSVQSFGLTELELNKNFDKLSDKEKNKIYEFISENAKLFKTKVGKNIRTRNKHKLDMGETIKKACQTNGIPMKLMFEKPKINKSKLILFLDISGSCRKASELMIYFAYQLKDLFGGGCKVYCFVNSLYDVSDIFDDNNDVKSVFENVLNQIPTKGAYSNYYIPFEDFTKNHMSDLTKDTIAIFIGDARNNQNETGEDNIKAIARKCKSSYWLNTEEIDRWNKKDSIISIYSKYMKNTFKVLNSKDLIQSLLNIK